MSYKQYYIVGAIIGFLIGYFLTNTLFASYTLSPMIRTIISIIGGVLFPLMLSEFFYIF